MHGKHVFVDMGLYVLQVMAIIVIGVGFLMSIPFHVVFHEKFTILKKLKWYQWLLKPNFYLVSSLRFSNYVRRVMDWYQVVKFLL